MKSFTVISLAVIVSLLVLGMVPLIGCGEEDGGMEKPIEPEPELTEAEREAEAEKKAVESVLESRKRAEEIARVAEETGDLSTFENDIETVYKEVFGFGIDLVGTLLGIHGNENPEDVKMATTVSPVGPVIEYLKLSYLHPEKSEEELLDLFREAARQGKTTVDPAKILERYGIQS